MNQVQKASISIFIMITLTTCAVLLALHNFIAFGSFLFTLLIWPWFSIFHSCGHNAYFKHKKINDLIGYLASVIVAIPFYSWKIHHATHHKWVGYAGMDPTSLEGNLPNKEKMKVINFLWKTWIPFIGITHVCTHLWNLKAVFVYVKKNNVLKYKTLFSFIIIPIIHFIIFLLLGKSFYLPWTVAMIFFILSSDIILLSQHALIPMKNSKQYIKPRPLQPRDHHYYTRSITFGYLIDRFVLLNFGEHSRHHKYPLESHFELHKKTFEGERRVNGWEWIKHIKSMHIRDILQTEFE